MKYITGIFIVTALLSSCEKVIEIDYKSNVSRMIIDGNITNQPGPYYVRITKSNNLTDTSAYPSIDNARITISDNAGNIEMLSSIGNGTYRTNTIVGMEGRTYTLTVQAENQTYTAQSTMPYNVSFDSIKVQTEMITGEIEYGIIPVYTDPMLTGNNYRFVLWLNNRLVNQHFVQNDEVRNGVTNTTRLEINDNDLELKTGDLIAIQMQCVDKNVFMYYTTLAQMGDSGPGGGTTPNNPPNNFTNGALGLFSAHTIQLKNAILP